MVELILAFCVALASGLFQLLLPFVLYAALLFGLTTATYPGCSQCCPQPTTMCGTCAVPDTLYATLTGCTSCGSPVSITLTYNSTNNNWHGQTATGCSGLWAVTLVCQGSGGVILYPTVVFLSGTPNAICSGHTCYDQLKSYTQTSAVCSPFDLVFSVVVRGNGANSYECCSCTINVNIETTSTLTLHITS
jgi:hypothetical protein